MGCHGDVIPYYRSQGAGRGYDVSGGFRRTRGSVEPRASRTLYSTAPRPPLGLTQRPHLPRSQEHTQVDFPATALSYRCCGPVELDLKVSILTQ